MFVVALVLAWGASPAIVVHSMRIERTETTSPTMVVRDRDIESLPTVRGLVQQLPHEFTLRGRSEVVADGWDRAMEMLRDDPAAKRGLVHAMSRASWSTMQPANYVVPALQLGRGQTVDRVFGLRRFDLSVQNGGSPVTVGHYWMPDPEPLGEIVMTSGIRLPGGYESTWTYRGGGWRHDTPQGRVETVFAPSQLDVERHGVDLNSVQFVLTNRTDDPVAGTVLAGQVLVPENDGVQRMVTTDDATYTVPPGGTATLDVPAACLDIAKKQPSSQDRFLAPVGALDGGTLDLGVANLANLTATSPVKGPWDQARIWVRTGGASMEQVNDRLGLGVSPLMYQTAVADVAMHGGLAPIGTNLDAILASLADPRSVMMGMADRPGRTSLLAANLGSTAGSEQIRTGAAEMVRLLKGLTPSAAQLDSLAQTCATLVWSGDPELMQSGVDMASTLEGGAKGFVARPEVRRALEFAGASPLDDVRARAQTLVPDSTPAPTLFALSHTLRLAESMVRDAFAATYPAAPPPGDSDSPSGFTIAFKDTPLTVDPSEGLSLALNATGGQPLATSFGAQSSPCEPARAISPNPSGAWRPDVAAPAVVNLTASVVSTDGQIARTSIPVYVGTTATLRSDLSDALRRAREARAREARARAEAERKRAAYQEALRKLWEHVGDLQKLQAADREGLDDLERIFRNPIQDLVKRNDELRAGAPPAPGNVDRAAADAQKAADDCMKELDDLRKQKADAEKRRDQLHDTIQGILDAVGAIYQGVGFTGGSGFHANGRGWFGWVGEGAGLPPAQNRQVSDLQRQLRANNRQMTATQQQIADLDAKIKAKEAECAKLAKRNEEAQQAKANQDEIKANDAQIGKAWDDLSGRLKEVADDLDGVEGAEGLARDAERLAETMPTTPAEWDRFWERLRALVQAKRELERRLEKQIEDDRKKARDLRDGASDAEGDAEDAASDAAGATAEAGAIQDEIDRKKKEAEAAGTQPPSPTAPAENPCMKKFAQWLAKYQDKMSKSQLDKLKEMMLGAAEAAQVPGVAVGEAIAGGAKALASGAGNAAVGLNAVASGFLSLGAGLFYAYAQHEIAKALGPLGSKIRLARIAGLLLGSREKCGEVGAGGVTGRGSESFFYFRVGDQLIVFRGGEGGVEFVGVGPAG